MRDGKLITARRESLPGRWIPLLRRREEAVPFARPCRDILICVSNASHPRAIPSYLHALPLTCRALPPMVRYPVALPFLAAALSLLLLSPASCAAQADTVDLAINTARV